jgi:putative transposase
MVAMLYSYAYRLYPNRLQTEALARLLELHRELYNAALEERREAWRRSRVSLTYTDQANQLKDIRTLRPEVAALNYSACQQTLRRLDKAYQAFFRRMRTGDTPGYPRFKSRSRFNSVAFVFGDGATRRNGRLNLQGIGVIKVKWHRPLPGSAVIKQVVVKRQGDAWSAVFQIDVPDPVEKPTHPGAAVGLDVGLHHLVALSTGECIQAPRYFRAAERQLRRQQRRVARRQRSSQGWRQAVRQVAKTHGHIANQRRDLAHQLSTRLVRTYRLIGVEALNVQGLARSRLAKSIHDAAWAQLLAMLDYKVAKTGSRVIRVDPRGTSQMCSACGREVPKDLGQRVHRCPHCGLELDRDVNAARNILRLALNSLGRSDESLTWAVAPSVLSEAAAF